MKRQILFGQPVAEDPSDGSVVKGRKKPAGKEKAEAIELQTPSFGHR